MGLTSILGAIVLTFLFIVPLAIAVKMLKRGAHMISVFQGNHSSFDLFVPTIVLSFVVGAVYLKTDMKLGRAGSIILSIAYLAFISYQYMVHFSDRD